MFDKFLEYVKAEELLKVGDDCIIGLSGGCDSVCLFLLLIEAAKELKLNLVAVHINHMIRKETAQRDEEFAAKLCENHGIRFIAKRINVPKMAEEMRISEEEAGRLARRDAFVSVGKDLFGNKFKIALAHHIIDNAETILYRMARGTGLKGLGGIAPKTAVSSAERNIEIIHPLLIFDKETIKRELTDRRQDWMEDETNEDTAYARNCIRKKVIPNLSEVNEAAVRHILDLSNDLRMVSEYISRQACAVVSDEIDREGRLAITAITDTNPVLHGRILAYWFEINKVSVRDLSRKHIKSIVDLAANNINGKVSVAGGVECVLEYGKLSLKKKQELEADNVENEYFVDISTEKLEESGELSVKIPGWRINFALIQPDEAVLRSENSFAICLNYDKIKTVCVRSRCPGDEIVITKDNKKKSVRRLLIDNKIPKSVRNTLPLLVCNDRVVWVCTIRQSMDYYVDEDTRSVLKVEAKKEKNYE